jgi:LPXTG-motif cell wall-anchored protein
MRYSLRFFVLTILFCTMGASAFAAIIGPGSTGNVPTGGAGVPGPIAGAGLPALLLAGGYLVRRWRKR